MDLSGKKVTVMGLGRFGGGVGVTRWLAANGADVLVTDLEPADRLSDSIDQIRPLVDSGAVELRLGGHNVSDFTTCDLVIANVAVPKPWDNRFTRAAEAANIPVTTEISLFLARLPAHARERTIAVTGSVGKSTTSAMIHHALNRAAAARGECERVLLGGNIGVSLLDELGSINDRTWLVLELSSAMLHWLDRDRTRGWSPRVAVITNISPNHIDWHGSVEHYTASKQLLLRSQRPADVAVLGESVWDWRTLTPAACKLVRADLFVPKMLLPGEHNRENAAAALLACAGAMPDCPPAVFADAIAAFGGLPHRLQLVAEKPRTRCERGEPMRFYNDSKSTTPESCIRAIEALAAMPGFAGSRIHLIAGGYDKGSDLSPIAHAAGRLAGLYTIGKTGPKLAEAAAGKAVQAGTLDAAFAAALERMRPGDALLLSPGCASWDQFINYEKRGEAFIRLVEELA
ncbi:MAG: UDP-N-acetylmuramoyl-L-alanine--D-glutamate ligase [Phycisphaerales bacterium]|nr:UDP-N-acetylmuramoyl-L-alanine--D-glutamate ligase [Phycisphaerales bacterium]